MLALRPVPTCQSKLGSKCRVGLRSRLLQSLAYTDPLKKGLKNSHSANQSSRCSVPRCSRHCLPPASIRGAYSQTPLLCQTLYPPTLWQQSANVPGRCSASSRKRAVHHAVSAAPPGGNSLDPPRTGSHVKAASILEEPLRAVRQELQKLNGQWDKFIPMIMLFFCCSVVNCLADSLKDSLVITAVGGGANVIPFLTVYAVLPVSLLFLILFSFASQRFSREQLFNVIIAIFMVWFVAFGLMFPHHEVLHLHVIADGLQSWLPSGFGGGIGMIRNWLFTAFYVSSELWGDIVLSLLFWGLANETTSLQEAALLYPLFGVGANIGQASAGKLLGVFTVKTAGFLTFAQQLQWTMGLLVVFGAAIVGLHRYIALKFKPRKVPDRVMQRAQQLAHQKADSTSHPGSSTTSHSANGVKPSLVRQQQQQHQQQQKQQQQQAGLTSSLALTSAPNGQEPTTGHAAEVAESQPPSAAAAIASADSGAAMKKLTVAEAFRFLIASKEVRCLALMAMAQGIGTNLLEVAWKNHLHMLHPSPQAYAAFMGDVAMWTGIVTGSLMMCSPLMFDRMGWRGVAGATPVFMLYTGVPFFVGCVAWNFAPAMTGTLGLSLLKLLVMSGALIQVFAKGTKFSMFKPAEEMVYITLDEESRTKGKAAIDVVGAQSGKAISSVLQQVLLLVTGGVMAGTLPVMGVAFFFMIQRWSAAVSVLADYQECVEYAGATSDSDNDDLVPEGALSAV